MGQTSAKVTLRRAGAKTRGVCVRLAAWLAIFALAAQIAFAPAVNASEPAAGSDAIAALGVLKSLLGPQVALCIRDASAPQPQHAPRHCSGLRPLPSREWITALVPVEYRIPPRLAPSPSAASSAGAKLRRNAAIHFRRAAASPANPRLT